MFDTTTNSEPSQLAKISETQMDAAVQSPLDQSGFDQSTQDAAKRSDNQSNQEPEALEAVTFDMSNKEDVLKCVDNALDDLESALARGQSEALKDYLKFLSRFHNYSSRNALLIYLQNPEASLVAGYQNWKKHGRQVMKGQKAIRILAPLIRKKKSDEAESPKDQNKESKKVVAGFRLASIFDVSQTDGDALPEIQGYSGDPVQNLDRLKDFVAKKEIELLFETPGHGALGVSEGGVIKVQPDLSPADTFQVLAHEVAHELLHKGDRRKDTTKTVRETEAEAVSFAVCEAVGLESNNHSSDYIHLHQGDVELFRESLEFIRKTASEILMALELSPKLK